MNDLTSSDYYQIAGLIIAGIIGILQMTFKIKGSNGRLNLLGVILVSLFLGAATVAIIATKEKAHSDKTTSDERERRFDTIIHNTINAIYKLGALKDSATEQSKSMSAQILMIKELNEESKELVEKNTFLYSNTILNEKNKEIYYRKRLSLSIDVLFHIFDYTLWKQPKQVDTITKESMLSSSIKSAKQIINGEYDNPYLIKHISRIKIWNTYNGMVSKLDLMINGYNPPSYQELFDLTYSTFTYLRTHQDSIDPEREYLRRN